MSVIGFVIFTAATSWMFVQRFVPPTETLIVLGALSVLLTFSSWASIEPESYRMSFLAFNVATYAAVALFLVVMRVQWNKPGQPFPVWATAVLCSLGVIASAVSMYFGIRNFARWVRGVYDDSTQEPA
jgi:hypothetical protein